MDARTLQARSAFAALVNEGSDDLPLDTACALIAAEEQPGVAPQLIINRLDLMAEEIHIPPRADLFEAIARINQHLFQRMGFHGDEQDYDHPRNSYLDRVLDRRKGLPILLSVLYIEIARRLDVAVDGVGFPGHFLVSPRPPRGGERFYLDPFNRGEILTRPRLAVRLEKLGLSHVDTWLAPVSSRAILTRIHNNLKRAHLRRGHLRSALGAVERLLLLDPDNADERRDRGLLLARLGENATAAAALEAYLTEHPQAPDSALIARQLQMLYEE
jgi:regulator of sirC expression with transglutaminase-like and TPR domain